VKLLLCAISLLSSCLLEGQQDTLPLSDVDLQVITISETVPSEPSTRELYARSSFSVLNLADELNNRSSAYIKSYGLGSLATLSLWGGSSNQNLVKWEEVPITNPMLGLSDLSLLPFSNSDQLKIYKGGCSAAHGSGAISGVLDLSSSQNYDTGTSISIDLTRGSFGRQGLNATHNYSNKKWISEIRLFHRKADNDFSYSLGSNEKTQTNADFLTSGLMITQGLKVSPENELRLNVWLQNSEVGIPPTTTQNRSVARQEDLTRRYRLAWQHLSDKLELNSFVAYLDEHNNFTDSLSEIFAQNRFKRLFHKTSAASSLSNTRYKLEYEFSNIAAQTPAYENGSQNQSIFALYGELRQDWNNFSFTAGLRNEWRTEISPPLIPQVNIQYELNQLTIMLKTSREFRAPTLNELFWRPGGNLDLQPENGWNQELWLSLRETNNWPSISMAFYHRRIQNWILWAPLESQQIWAAYNIGEVRSYGFDLNVQKTIHWGAWKQELQAGMAYSRSENLVGLSLPRIAVGDQLLYTPLVRAHINYTGSWKQSFIAIQTSYTGPTNGINEDLDSYWVTNLSIGQALHLAKIKNTLRLELNNIMDTEYRVIERRPMPGRYFTLNWTINFNTENKTL